MPTRIGAAGAVTVAVTGLPGPCTPNAIRTAYAGSTHTSPAIPGIVCGKAGYDVNRNTNSPAAPPTVAIAGCPSSWTVVVRLGHGCTSWTIPNVGGAPACGNSPTPGSLTTVVVPSPTMA